MVGWLVGWLGGWVGGWVGGGKAGRQAGGRPAGPASHQGGRCSCFPSLPPHVVVHCRKAAAGACCTRCAPPHDAACPPLNLPLPAASSCRPEAIDPALRRPGRFDREVSHLPPAAAAVCSINSFNGSVMPPSHPLLPLSVHDLSPSLANEGLSSTLPIAPRCRCLPACPACPPPRLHACPLARRCTLGCPPPPSGLPFWGCTPSAGGARRRPSCCSR